MRRSFVVPGYERARVEVVWLHCSASACPGRLQRSIRFQHRSPDHRGDHAGRDGREAEREREREREINGRWKWTDREHYHLTAFVADELRGTIRDFRMSDRQDQSFAWATKREVDRHRAALQIFTKRDRGRMACAERVAAFLNKIGCAATYKQGDRRQGPSQRYSRLVVKVAAITGRGSLTGQRSREASLAERMTKTLAPGDMGGQHAGLLRFQTLRVLCPCR